MARKTKEVALVSGEMVVVALDSDSQMKQTFVRMGKRLIAGVVDDLNWQGVYIWQEVGGVYQYLGDLVFEEQEDGSVIWSICPWVPPGFEKRAASLLVEQGKQYGRGASPCHIKVLSIASVIKE